MAEHNALPVEVTTEDLYHDPNIDEATRQILSIQTYYERMWLERGLAIRYLRMRLPHEGSLSEPEVDIPIDDYRSYRREKRTPLETGR